MSKMKTKSGAKKRFRLTGTGKVRMLQAYKRHNMRKRSNRMLRNSKGMVLMAECDAKIVKKNFIPYGLN